MLTASWFSYAGPGRIGFSRSAPPRVQPGYTIYAPLVPGPWFKAVDYDTYRRRYYNQLRALDARRVWEDLHQFAAGAEPVLLCWEQAGAGRWCHWAMVAAWLGDRLGVPIEEVGHPGRVGRHHPLLRPQRA
ncbi:hypothetical protein [Azospirillum sp. sgz302134]